MTRCLLPHASACAVLIGLSVTPFVTTSEAGPAPSSFVATAPVPAPKVRFASIFGNHMVIQRDTTISLWGYGDPGVSVSVAVSWDANQNPTAICDRSGRFALDIATPPAGGPHTITLTGNGSTVQLEDVQSGEVWLCSGQSNMEWHMEWTPEGIAELPEATHADIRFFDVRNSFDPELQREVTGHWARCTPASAASFSAVAYFFGRDLHHALNGVPIGLVNASWGGSTIEAWTSSEALAEHGDFDVDLDRILRVRAGEDVNDLTPRQGHWWNVFEANDQGMTSGWFESDFDDAAWSEVVVPMDFTDIGADLYDGSMWFRRSFTAPLELLQTEVALTIGAIDDMDMVWINGVLVASTRYHGAWNQDRAYVVPPGVLQPGENTITVMVMDTGGGGSFGGLGDAPIGAFLKRSDGTGDRFDLAGLWRYQPGTLLSTFGAFPTEGWLHRNTPTTLYNAMIAPIRDVRLAGVIWYQGEANIQRAAQYRSLLPTWVNDWRHTFGSSELPVFWVQLAPWAMPGDQGHVAELRESQALATRLIETGMAVSMDIGDPNNIHPANKDVVGHRLSRLALRDVYSQNLAAEGPRFREATREGRFLRLSFDNADRLNADDAALEAFTIAGEDQVFHLATAVVEGTSVLLSADAVPSPVAARFAWAADAVVLLTNGDGLPASSFRTDDWPMVTEQAD